MVRTAEGAHSTAKLSYAAPKHALFAASHGKGPGSYNFGTSCSCLCINRLSPDSPLIPPVPASLQKLDMRAFVMVGGADVGSDAEDAAEQVFGQDLCGRAIGDDAALFQHDDAVAEHGGVVEVMQRDDAGDGQACNELQQADLVLDVQMVGRLIKDQLARALGQGAGDVGALLFAAREMLPALVPLGGHA